MDYTIEGELAQVARLTLDAGDGCWAAKGSLVSMDAGLRWSLRVPGGVGGAAKRMLAGEGAALTRVEASADGQSAVLGANRPGKIIAWDLADGPVVASRGSFVAAFGPSVEIDVIVARRTRAAFFGGVGLFLQRLAGRGVVLVHGSGDFLDHRLGKGESMLVSTGNLAAFGEGVDYDIQGVGGCRRMLFGGEGLFMTRLTGPGRVLLQSLERLPQGRPRGGAG